MTDWRNVGADASRLVTINDLLGADSADNTQATTLVASNADGSALERLEYLQAQLALYAGVGTPATFVPGLGFRVTKTEDGSVATGDDLFTVTGKVLITLWTAEVTNALGATAKFSDYKISMTTLNADLCAAGDISSSIVGHIFNLNGDAGDTSLSSSTYAVSVSGSADHNGKGLAYRVVGKAGGSDVLKSVRTAGDSGDAIIHIVFYYPLEAGASIAAAA